MLKYPSIENHFNISKSKKIMAWIDRLFYATNPRSKYANSVR